MLIFFILQKMFYNIRIFIKIWNNYASRWEERAGVHPAEHRDGVAGDSLLGGEALPPAAGETDGGSAALQGQTGLAGGNDHSDGPLLLIQQGSWNRGKYYFIFAFI